MKRMLIIFTLLLYACYDNKDEKCDLIKDFSKTDYAIVGTNQTSFFDDVKTIAKPEFGQQFYGQDAQYNTDPIYYIDLKDGTILDSVTGLYWEKEYRQVTWNNASTEAQKCRTGGYDDWRVPTIKELYSLMLFSGNQGTGNPSSSTPPDDAKPFIDTDFFKFEYPTTGRYIDAQFISQTEVLTPIMNNDDSFYGCNFADGRIKGYPKQRSINSSKYYAIFVRGNSNYGKNQFSDNEAKTILDASTKLEWTKFDSGSEVFENQVANTTKKDGSLNWKEALSFCENLDFDGKKDWRLPNTKELHSIVDYSRSPDATKTAAIDLLFEASQIMNEDSIPDYPSYWTSTSFEPGNDAVVIYFGRALGKLNEKYIDVHGAGAQRTDSKIGEPSSGNGPQGDVRRVYNYVRCVRDIEHIKKVKGSK
jgi:hypothetical protein